MKKRLVRILLILTAVALLLATAVLAEDSPLNWSISEGVLTVSGTAVPDYDESPAPWAEQAEAVTKVVVEDGTVTIGANAFADLVNAGELTLPGSVTALGENALPEQLRGSEADFAGTLVTFGAEAVTIPAVPEQEGKTGTWNAYTLKSGETAAVEAAYENVYHAVFVADGQTVAAVEFTEGAVSVEEPAVPEKAGYTGAWEPYTLGAEDLEIHAVYTPVTYHAAFVAGGKTVATVEFTVETASLTEPAVPARTGYTGAWEAYTLGAGDVTVNAVYTPVTYHATFTAGGKTVAKVPFTVETKSIQAPQVPAKTGYTGKWETYTLGTKDITVKAVYTEVTYKVTFQAGGKTVATRNYTVEKPSVTAPAVPAKTGYTGKWESYKLTTGDVTVKAVYTPVTYYATFTADGKTVAKVSFTVESKSIQAPQVPARSGYTGKWESYTLGAKNITVKAVYTFASYRGTVTASLLNVRTGPSTGTECCGGLARGSVVTITAEQSDGAMTWGRLDNGNWISLSYVSRIAEEPAPSNPGGSSATKWTATVNASMLNVRSGPGTGYGVQGGLGRGASVTYVEEQNGTDGNRWCRLSTGGWVSKTYLANICAVESQQPSQPAEPAKPSQPAQGSGSYTATVHVSTTLNVRSGPGTSTSVVGSLRSGDRVTVTAETENGGMTWAKIDQGWVSKTYLTNIQTVEQPSQPAQPSQPNQPSQPSASSAREVQITASVLNVRSGPGTNNSIVGSLRNGERASVVETSGNWGRLSGGGWICMDYTMDVVPVSVQVTGDFRYTFATYSTDCSTSSSNRKTNLRLACEAINGTILAPGGSFSYNATLGPRTPEKGYMPAPYYGAGGITYGGGICQVSTTLFNSVLLGNLEVIERVQHVQSVSYVPRGRDAAVNWGTQDFRFRNNSNYYIQIVAVTDGNTITVSLMTREDVSPAGRVTLEVAQSGNLYTLRRYYNGQLNYTTESRY